MSTNYLIHHGIKGQKWGVRRYQNPDGSLTEEGRSRYRVTDATKKTYSDKMNKLYEKEHRTEKEEKTLRSLENGKRYVEDNFGDVKIKDFFSKEKRKDYLDGKKWLNSTNYMKGLNTAAFVGWLVGGLPGEVITGGIYNVKNRPQYEKEINESRKKRLEDERG